MTKSSLFFLYNSNRGVYMKIERFSSVKNGMYILTLENKTKIKIHEDLILKYGLLLSKQLEEEVLPRILEENKEYEIYEVALKYITIRLRSRTELMAYLRKKEYTETQISGVIERLISQGYLNDSIYATSFIHDRILMSSDGPNKIQGELERMGIHPDVVRDKLTVFTEELEQERIQKLIQKKWKSNHNKGSNLLKQKVQAYLLSLGYTPSYISSALKNATLDDSDIYKKEYEKLYQKLSKKYTGKELEYKLKQKLYRLGFSISDVDS